MLSTILILLLLFFALFRNVKYRKTINQFNGPPTKLFIGNLHQIGKNHLALINFFKFWHLYGKSNFRIWVGHKPIIFVTNVKDVEFILTSDAAQEKADFYGILHPWMGNGLVTSFGAHWHKHRKIITPSFHFKVLQNYHKIMTSTTTKFMCKLKEIAANDAIIDFQDMARRVGLDTICETAMGVTINAIDGSSQELFESVHYMLTNLKERLLHPLWCYNSLFRLTPEYKVYKKHLNNIKDFINQTIKKKLEFVEFNELKNSTSNEETKTMSFMERLFLAKIDGCYLTQNEVYDEVTTIISAGHDTTSATLAFAAHLLSRNPCVQQKVYAEQKAIMGERLKCDATFQDIECMRYLDLVIKETLRLYPGVPIIARKVGKTFELNGLKVPKGTTIDIFLMAMGYNEENFPDPYRFRPERFDGKITKSFELLPFSAGPRNCIGQKFAVLQLKTIISKLVRTFELLPPLDDLVSVDGYVEHTLGMSAAEIEQRNLRQSKFDPILTAALTLSSTNGIQLRLRERTTI